MSFDQAGAAVSTMGRGDGGGDSSASRLPSLPTSLPVPTPVFDESLLHDVFAEGGDEGLFEVGVERDTKSRPVGTNGEEEGEGEEAPKKEKEGAEEEEGAEEGAEEEGEEVQGLFVKSEKEIMDLFEDDEDDIENW